MIWADLEERVDSITFFSCTRNWPIWTRL